MQNIQKIKEALLKIAKQNIKDDIENLDYWLDAIDYVKETKTRKGFLLLAQLEFGFEDIDQVFDCANKLSN